MTKDKDTKNKKGSILSEMAISTERPSAESGGLVVEPESETNSDKAKFENELSKTLSETENRVLLRKEVKEDPNQTNSWLKARKVVQDFQPVPWFIWRLSNYVLGTQGQIRTINEGFVLGLRRLLFATASDDLLGSGEKVNDVKTALRSVTPDVIASVSVIHAVCRRLASKQFERIWRPILDDAILRCQIGFSVGQFDESFGSGRGMLAGFASRCGLALLLASGDLDQARSALESLATGSEISQVGMQIYECDPLQVSAMMLSGSGCGRDAAYGTVSYAYKDSVSSVENMEQLKWLAAFTLTEKLRIGRDEDIDSKLWEALGITDESNRKELFTFSKKIVRRGHGWNWIF